MYHGQEIVGFCCVLCCKRGIELYVFDLAALIEKSTVVGVCEIVGVVGGLVGRGDLRRVREYHTVCDGQGLQDAGLIGLVEIFCIGCQSKPHTPVTVVGLLALLLQDGLGTGTIQGRSLAGRFGR